MGAFGEGVEKKVHFFVGLWSKADFEKNNFTSLKVLGVRVEKSIFYCF